MKYLFHKIFFLFSFFLLFFSVADFAYAKTATTTEDFRGEIVLQSAHYNDVWYVHPKTSKRYVLYNSAEAMNVMRKVGKGIFTKDLERIPEPGNSEGDAEFAKRFFGYILLQVESKGEAWYVNPDDGYRYYLKDGNSAIDILKKFGVEMKNSELAKYPMNTEQIVSDFTFTKYSHVKLLSGKYSQTYYADAILPLASLSKLMTALVALDLKPKWDKKVTITQEDLGYQKIYVDEDDATSEIDFQVGDTVTLQDLWNAMLAASSNQAAALLSKNVGISKEAFVKKMNEKAKSMGLKKTRFTDPSGLDIYNVGTAKEMAAIARAAFNIAKIKNTTVKSYTIEAKRPDETTRDITVVNRNKSILKFGPDAAKSGFLHEAQRNVAYKKGSAIVVILHARNLGEKNTLIKKLMK